MTDERPWAITPVDPDFGERISRAIEDVQDSVDYLAGLRDLLDKFSTRQVRGLRRMFADLAEPEDRPTPPRIEPGWLSLIEAGEYLGFTPGTIRTWVHDGRIPAKRFGRAIRIRIEDLDGFGDAMGIT